MMIIIQQKLCVTKAPLRNKPYSGTTKASDGNAYKYPSGNKNCDICVADRQAHAVVVVSAAGKLRFRYTGPPSTPRTRESFELISG